MSEQGKNVLISWVSLVMLTLWQLGITPRHTKSTTVRERESLDLSKESLGMLGFVKQTIAMVEGGMTLSGIQKLQAVSPPDPSI